MGESRVREALGGLRSAWLHPFSVEDFRKLSLPSVIFNVATVIPYLAVMVAHICKSSIWEVAAGVSEV